MISTCAATPLLLTLAITLSPTAMSEKVPVREKVSKKPKLSLQLAGICKFFNLAAVDWLALILGHFIVDIGLSRTDGDQIVFGIGIYSYSWIGADSKSLWRNMMVRTLQ